MCNNKCATTKLAGEGFILIITGRALESLLATLREGTGEREEKDIHGIVLCSMHTTYIYKYMYITTLNIYT
jgi:hypothetical protein